MIMNKDRLLIRFPILSKGKRYLRFFKGEKCLEIKDFCKSHYSDFSSRDRSRIVKDMMWNYLHRGISPSQYWDCQFEDLTEKDKAGMLPVEELYLFDRVYNPRKDIHIVGDKYDCYLHFKPYYGRDCILVRQGNRLDLDCFHKFVSENERIIIKPLGNNSGVGVSILESKAVLENQVLFPDYDFIAEQIIEQRMEMGKFHPQSVNTLRLNTIKCKDEILIKWSILRYGCGNRVVDNAHFGGIFSVIDDDGNAIAAGDVHRHKYQVHPDTGVPLTGFMVPEWEKACALVRSLATNTAGLRFIGWDLALTDQGWVLVEANTSPGILSPMVTGKGIRKEFYQIKKQM